MFILALLASCSKDYIEEEIVFNSTPIKQEVQEIVVTPTQVQSPVLFQSKAPSYSGVNNTVGSIRKQYYYPGNNNLPGHNSLDQFTLDNKLYKSTLKSSAYLDFDSNGQLDLFSVLSSLNDGSDNGLSWGGDCSTKIRIVKNVFTDQSEEFIYDSPYNFPSAVQVNDMNGDGVDDVIIGGHNSHVCASYSGDFYGEHLPTHVYYINQDGTFDRADVTPPTSFYDMASGDIDNDGDVDIIYFSQMLYNPSPGNQEGKPWIYLNDGLGNFVEANSYDHFIGLEEILNSVESGRIHNNTINLFDLNNDNILDLVIASDPFWQSVDTVNEKQEDYPFWVQAFNEYTYGARVYWGEGQGVYNMNVYSDIANEWINNLNTNRERLMYNGISFVDYNNDNYYDIVFNGTPTFKGYYVQLAINNKDLTFDDKTIEMVDQYWNYTGNNDQFSNLIMYDKDGDGDYDWVPSGSERHFNRYEGAWSDVFYYRNDGGVMRWVGE